MRTSLLLKRFRLAKSRVYRSALARTAAEVLHLLRRVGAVR